LGDFINDTIIISRGNIVTNSHTEKLGTRLSFFFNLGSAVLSLARLVGGFSVKLGNFSLNGGTLGIISIVNSKSGESGYLFGLLCGLSIVNTLQYSCHLVGVFSLSFSIDLQVVGVGSSIRIEGTFIIISPFGWLSTEGTKHSSLSLHFKKGDLSSAFGNCHFFRGHISVGIHLGLHFSLL